MCKIPGTDSDVATVTSVLLICSHVESSNDQICNKNPKNTDINTTFLDDTKKNQAVLDTTRKACWEKFSLELIFV